jgi:hypothetical protein
MDDELREIEAATRAVSAAAHTATDRMLPPATARAVLFGGRRDDDCDEHDGRQRGDAGRDQPTWVELGFGWRLTRVQ